MSKSKLESRETTRKLLLDTAMRVLRTKGYAATTVDDLCQAAGVTKGAFFHHFPSKEALGIAAADHFGAMADGFFTTAPYNSLPDPLARLLGYIDFRSDILQGDLCDYTCLLGTFVQELYETHPALRAAAEKHLQVHLAMLTRDIEAAKQQYAPAGGGWTAHSLAVHMQAVLQGAFIFAKATGDPAAGAALTRESLAHLRRYIESLFKPH